MTKNNNGDLLIGKLTKDLKQDAKKLTDNEARYLVNTYYQMQEYRKATNNQVRSVFAEYATEENLVGKDGKPAKFDLKDEQVKDFVSNSTLSWFADNFSSLETQIKVLLREYVESKPIGLWLLSICGIGEVISAGLLAHVNIEKAPTVGHIWAFAGLDPTKTWGKGEKRPFNADLKTLCWKVGQSFVKVSNNDKDVYGHIYKVRKGYESDNNELGLYSEQAINKLATVKIGKDTDAYKYYSIGKLPPAHIQQRAERYATKIFLSHFHAVWYELHYGVKPPKPFAIAILNHAHEIAIPNWGAGNPLYTELMKIHTK